MNVPVSRAALEINTPIDLQIGLNYSYPYYADRHDVTYALAVTDVGGRPEYFTYEEQRAYLDSISGVSCGSDAFFPFFDNVQRAAASGVSYIAQPGGSIRDDAVIDCCNKLGIAMAFTGMRLFHH